jgi:hypothetical protein
MTVRVEQTSVGTHVAFTGGWQNAVRVEPVPDAPVTEGPVTIAGDVKAYAQTVQVRAPQER